MLLHHCGRRRWNGRPCPSPSDVVSRHRVAHSRLFTRVGLLLGCFQAYLARGSCYCTCSLLCHCVFVQGVCVARTYRTKDGRRIAKRFQPTTRSFTASEESDSFIHLFCLLQQEGLLHAQHLQYSSAVVRKRLRVFLTLPGRAATFLFSLGQIFVQRQRRRRSCIDYNLFLDRHVFVVYQCRQSQ